MKQNTGRKLLGVLLALVLVLGLVPGMGLTAYAATNYDLWIGGTQVTSDNLSGTGWSYDAGTNTLTLNGYSYSGTGHSWTNEYETICYAIIYTTQGLKIDLNGTNILSHETNSDVLLFGIYAGGDLTITGSGKLTVAGSDGGVGIECNNLTVKSGTISASGFTGIHTVNDLIIEDGTVAAKGDGEASMGIHAENNLTINGGSVKAECRNGEVEDDPTIGYSIIALNNVTIKNGDVTASGGEYGYGIVGGSVTIEDGTVTATGQVGIGAESDEGTGITISGGVVKAEATGENVMDAAITSMTDVTISGGTVTASGNIGVLGLMGNITINGGYVTATSSVAGLYALENISISQGTVEASGRLRDRLWY